MKGMHLQDPMVPGLPQRRRFGALLGGIPVPLTAPSLSTLDARVENVLQRAADVRGLRPTTIRWARQSYRSLRRFISESRCERRFLGGDLRQQVEILQRWVGWLRTNGAHSVAVNTTWRGAASIFRWIAEEDALLSPFAFIEPPRFARVAPAFLSRKDCERVLTFVRNAQWENALVAKRNLAIVGLMVLAGLRRGEVLRLTAGDIHIDTGRIEIRGGKGMFGGTDRSGWMCPQLALILADYLPVRARAKPKRTHPELITHARVNRAVSTGVTQHLFWQISAALQLRVTPHALRHSYATLLRQAGVADRVAMELLGHKSLTMLQRYSHVEADEPRQAAALLNLDVSI